MVFLCVYTCALYIYVFVFYGCKFINMSGAVYAHLTCAGLKGFVYIS